MVHSCGQEKFRQLSDTNGFMINIQDDCDNYITLPINTIEQQLYTAYLGQVPVTAPVSGDIVSLEKYHIVDGQSILVKVLDATEHNLSTNVKYSLNKLKSLSAMKISIKENKYYYVATLLCTKKMSQLINNSELLLQTNQKLQPFFVDTEMISRLTSQFPELISEEPVLKLKEYKKIYQKVVEYNSCIDIFFGTYNYLDFLYKTTEIVSVNGLNSILSISGIPKLDNAFFTGEYMAYGGGEKHFYPLTSLDVVGHELSHGFVSGTSKLEYKGHSGALNESFSDIMGVMFEFYMYETFKLNGESDWLIGEDLGMKNPFLRSMENPHKGNQPDKYKGKYYIDPHSKTDYGGVHINSGIPNYCFYLACKYSNKDIIIKPFVECFKQLDKKSDFINFRDTLKRVSNNNECIIKALNKVGLNDSVISDYKNHQPQQSKPQPQQQKYPYPRQKRYPYPRQKRYPYPRQKKYPYPRQHKYPYPRQQRYPQQHKYPYPQQQRYPYPQQQIYQYPQQQIYQYPQQQRYPYPQQQIYQYPQQQIYQYPQQQIYQYPQQQRYPYPQQHKYQYPQQQIYQYPQQQNLPDIP